MTAKRVCLVLGWLGAACVGFACGLRAQSDLSKKTAPEDVFLKEQQEWMAQFRQRMLADVPMPFGGLGGFFMQPPLGRFDGAAPGFSLPPLSDDIRSDVRSTDKEVILTMRVPGLDEKSLNLRIEKDRIRISYDVKKIDSKADDKGREYFRSESSEHFEKVLPLPAGADPNKNRIERQGDVLRLIFKRRPDPSVDDENSTI